MLRHAGCLLSLGCLLSPMAGLTEMPSWSEKFVAERAKALGPVRRQSTQEVKQFLLFEGHDVRKTRATRPRSIEAVPAVLPAEAVDAEATVVDNSRPKARRPRGRKKKPTPAPPPVVPIEALLEKSRRAYASGRLDEARRYYSLVQRADPGSAEAEERLREINKEME